MARQLPWALLLLVVGFLVIWPLYQLQGRAFAHGAAGYAEISKVPALGTMIWLTVLLGTASVAIALVLGTALAWAMRMMSSRSRRMLRFIPVLPLLTPAVAMVMGWIFMFSPNAGYGNTVLRATGLFGQDSGPVNIYSIAGIVLFTGYALTGFVYLFVNSALQDMGQEYEEAGYISGASSLRIFFTITLPLLRPALVYGSGTVLLLGLGQFAAPLLLGTRLGVNVITTYIFSLTQQFPINFGLGAALGSPLLVIALLIVISQRLLLGNPDRYVVNRRSPSRATIRRRKTWIPAVAVIIYGSITTILPLLALALVAVQPFWSGKINFSKLTFQNVQIAFSQPQLLDAMEMSLKAAGISMLIVIPLGTAVALGNLPTSRVWRPLKSLLDVVAAIPLAIPTALTGFAILFAYSQSPFHLYGTFWIVVIAYVTVMLPFASRLMGAALLTVGAPLIEAARMSGAGPVRTFITVVLPQLRLAVASACAVIVVLLFQEFGASLMVTSVHTQVIGTILYTLLQTGIYPQVAVMALVMFAVTLTGLLVVFAITFVRPLSFVRAVHRKGSSWRSSK